MSSIFLACSVKWLGARWAYLRTISLDSHPPISWSTDNGTPDGINLLARVCLRSWKRKFSTPARRQADSHAVLLSMCIFLTAGVDVPSARLAALVCTPTFVMLACLITQHFRGGIVQRHTNGAVWFAIFWIHPGNLSLHVNLLPLQIYDVRLSQNSYQRKFDDRFQ